MLTWGDQIRIKSTAPIEYRPGDPAEIVGIWIVKTVEQANSFNQPIGAILYTVEYGDGSDKEISSEYIERVGPIEKF